MNKKIKTMASISLAALLMNSNVVLASADVPEIPTIRGIFRKLGADFLKTANDHLLTNIAPKLVNIEEADLERFLDAIGQNICDACHEFKAIVTPDPAENPMGQALIETTSILLWTYTCPLGRTVKTFAKASLSDTKRRAREGLRGWRGKIGERAQALRQPQALPQIVEEDELLPYPDSSDTKLRTEKGFQGWPKGSIGDRARALRYQQMPPQIDEEDESLYSDG